VRLLLRIARALRRADRRSLCIVLSLGMVVGVGATGTFAAWTDSVTVSGTSITTGTIDLQVNGSNNVTGYSTMNISNMVPGNSTAGVLTVTNAGTAPLKYYLDASGTNGDGKGLAAALVAKVSGDSTTSGSAPAKTCGGVALGGAGVAFGPGLLGSAASPRLLAAGTSETLCIQATLPSSATSTLQGASTSITFTFQGTSF
jgi:predicted ribosomally synthesized peptide with SipW-like signal peptide